MNFNDDIPQTFNLFYFSDLFSQCCEPPQHHQKREKKRLVVSHAPGWLQPLESEYNKSHLMCLITDSRHLMMQSNFSSLVAARICNQVFGVEIKKKIYIRTKMESNNKVSRFFQYFQNTFGFVC
jgi:hypothetical protein